MNAIISIQQDISQYEQDEWSKAYMIWIVEDVQATNTRKSYHRAWQQFRLFIGYKHYGAIDTEDVAKWKVHLRQSLQPSSINQKLSALNSFFKFINARYGYLRDDNPAQHVKQLTVNPYGKATLLTDNQDIDLLSSIDQTTFEGLRDYTIILMFLTTGVRLAAIASATLNNIRRAGSVVHFSYTGKRNKQWEKRLPTHTAKTVLQYLERRGKWEAGSIFGMERYQIQYMLEKRCDAVFGIGHGITVHSLRHTAANNAAKNGTIQDIRSLLDHESTRVTAIYLDHVSNEQGEKMSDLLDSRYGK